MMPFLVAASLASAYAGLLAYIYITQDQRFFPSDGEPFCAFPGLAALQGLALSSERSGQVLRYYLVPAQGQGRAWVLLFHGNRHGARERLDYAQHLAPLGMNVVLAEYPGYALPPAQGAEARETATEASVLRNALAMADLVLDLAKGAPVFYFGESLGTGPATYCAMRRPSQGLLLSTPYTTMADVAASGYAWLPVGPFVRHRFPAWRWAPHVKAKVLVLHGTQDKTIPFALGSLQASRFASHEMVALAGKGHGDLREGAALWDAARRYLEERLEQGA